MSIFGFGLFWVTIPLNQIQPLSYPLNVPLFLFLSHPEISRPPWPCSTWKHTNTLVRLMYWMVCETQPWSTFEILLLLSKGNSVCASISATHTKWDPRLVLWNYLHLRKTSEWTKAYFYLQNLCAQMSVSKRRLLRQHHVFVLDI